MNGIYKNFQTLPYGKMSGKLDYIILKSVKYTRRILQDTNIKSNYEIDDEIDDEMNNEINDLQYFNIKQVYPSFSYLINVLNNVKVEYVNYRVYPINEINIFIKRNVYFTDIDLLHYYDKNNLDFQNDDEHVFYYENKLARDMIGDYHVINIFDILLNKNKYSEFLFKFIVDFIMNITQLDLILILTKNDIYKIQVLNYNDGSLNNNGLEFICDTLLNTVKFNNEYIYYDNDNMNDIYDPMLNIYINKIINSCTNICLSKSGNTYKLIYFNFNPFMFFNESFYNFDVIKGIEENYVFSNNDVLNKTYHIYELNINMDNIMIDSNNLFLLAFLHNNTFLLHSSYVNQNNHQKSSNTKYHISKNKKELKSYKILNTDSDYQILNYNYDQYFDSNKSVLMDNYFYFIIDNKFLQQRYLSKIEYYYNFSLYKDFCKILLSDNNIKSGGLRKSLGVDDDFEKKYTEFSSKEYKNYETKLKIINKNTYNNDYYYMRNKNMNANNMNTSKELELDVYNFIYPTP